MQNDCYKGTSDNPEEWREKSLAKQRLAMLAREGGPMNVSLVVYVQRLEKELGKYGTTHMAEVWRKNQRAEAVVEAAREVCQHFDGMMIPKPLADTLTPVREALRRYDGEDS